jgi:acetolactate decarboxylase
MRRVLDERWIRSLHVEAMHREEAHGGHEPHVLFQASTIGALLEGAYEGDMSFAELAEQGDLGLGTVNHLDGEMIALDGSFMRADVDGVVHPVPPEEMTPFAVVVRFEPTAEVAIESPLDHAALLARLDQLAPDSRSASCAFRVDGVFDLVRARSVPRQDPPYRPLTEVAAAQNVFELSDVEGTLVGFRFPTYAEGIEVPGYHLHFVDSERARGGHVLEAAIRHGHAAVDPSDELHVELPPRVDLTDPDLSAETHQAVLSVEGG